MWLARVVTTYLYVYYPPTNLRHLWSSENDLGMCPDNELTSEGTRVNFNIQLSQS